MQKENLKSNGTEEIRNHSEKTANRTKLGEEQKWREPQALGK